MKLNILAIADRKPEVSPLEVLKHTQIDLIVTLGDLEHSDIRDLEQITDIPKIGVYGNHCSGLYFDPLGIKNMHLTTWEYKGIVFGGFEGSVRYKDSKYAKMYTQEEAVTLLKNFPRVDVMLVHCPPYGVNDDQTELAHTGYIGLRDYVIEKKPHYLFHGHTYPSEQQMIHALESTFIQYVFGHAVISIEV